ncbi:N-acetyllactosaminide 3-alpha-galactosyltransferase [Ancylostoma ceylanicum]|uniref:Beta-1,4-N-acetylgalactosaminyltransferase n=1 Tax=Ancylostoma ceylanicum TaxID=53326 RepID=A0A0D6LK58_9BILA|nr:N-acetyllactosaminide 3-alpha-galactosyltransferase [Ancylostoma ceylanicum]
MYPQAYPRDIPDALSLNSDLPHIKTASSVHHVTAAKTNVARPLHVLDEPDPKELENARQTLNFLNNIGDSLEAKQTPRTTLTALPGGVCPDPESVPDLWGSLPQAVLLIENLQEADVSAAHPEVKPGGEWSPTDCKARHRVAIIIPFRDRQSHLTRLLDFLIPVLQRQRLDFRFIVTEQYGNDLFNKGRIMNAAFRFAETLNVDCVIFHDVDMFPQDDRNPYSCPPAPRHMGAFVSNLGYQLWYKEIVGGVLAVSMEDYRLINGYSNMYWAWGGEDDDMGKRILSLNYTIERPDPDTGRYSMLKHVKRKRTAPKLIYKLLEIAEKRVAYDGLNETNKWTVRKITVRPLYYHLYVDVGSVPDEWREKKS